MPVLKKIRTKDFLQVSRDLAQNAQLSYEAKGLLIEMLSYPENWVFQKSSFFRENCKYVKIHRIFRELKQAGFLYLLNIYENGKIVDRVWIASSEPICDEVIWKEQIKSLTIGNLIVRKPYVKKNLNNRKPHREETSPIGNLKMRFSNTNKNNIYIKNTNNIKNNIPTDCNSQKLDIKYTEDFETFWSFYPKRGGDNSKSAAFRNWKRLLKNGVSAEDLLIAVKNYQIISKKKNNVETEFIFKASNFLGRDKIYEDYINIKLEEINNYAKSKSRNTMQHQVLKEIHKHACEEIEKDKC